MVRLTYAVRTETVVQHVNERHDHSDSIWVTHLDDIFVVEDETSRRDCAEGPQELFFADRCLFTVFQIWRLWMLCDRLIYCLVVITCRTVVASDDL